MNADALVREIGETEVESTITGTDMTVIVEFYATWCGACRRLAPVLDSLAAEFADRVEVVKLNVDENPVAVARYGITSTPTMLAFAGGRVTDTLVGDHHENTVRDWFRAAGGDPTQPGDLLAPWVPVQACTLPTAEQPLRVNEFAALFTESVQRVDRTSPTLLRLQLAESGEAAARELAARESECCSFFRFGFFRDESAGAVWMEIEVPPGRTEVLDGLTAHASAARQQ